MLAMSSSHTSISTSVSTYRQQILSGSIADFSIHTSPPRQIVFANVNRDTRPEYVPHHQQRAEDHHRSSLPTIIYINATNTHGLRQEHQHVLLDTALMHADYPGSIHDICFDNYLVIFIHHDLVTRVAVYFLFADARAQFASLSYFIYFDISADNFYTPTAHGNLLFYCIRLLRVPTFACPALETP
jgi:hypothetical protein